MSHRWRKAARTDPNQFQLDWTGRVQQESNQGNAAPATEMILPPASGPAGLDPPGSPHPALSQGLPWDFAKTFPDPLPDAVERGAIREQDAEPLGVKSMHEELGRQLMKVLSEMDAVHEARRSGRDPKSNQSPSTRAGRTRLKQFAASEARELERSWQALMGVHEAAFGTEANEAFDKAVRARHAGVEVIAEPGRQPSVKLSAETLPIEPVKVTAAASVRSTSAAGHAKRVPRLPVPRPLAEAIAAGHFGTDEQGRPIDPSDDEVHAITNDHAEELIELIDSLPPAGQKMHPSLAGVETEIQQAVAKYAEDFGSRAAQQLEAYARRQVRHRSVESPASEQHGR